MALTFWGLKTCDTCKKAQKALAAAGVAFEAKDVRADGVPADELRRWIGAVGADALANRRSTTWRNLSDEEKAAAEAPDALLDLLAANPTIIKRPVVLRDEEVFVGWSKDVQAALM